MLATLLEPWLPPACACCGLSGLVVCDECRSRLVPIGAIPPPAYCAGAWAAFVYDDTARQLIHTFKFRRSHSLAPWLADCIVAALPLGLARPDVVTWVPASRRKRSRRGFDQAQLLAARVASRLDVACCPLLERHDWGSQTRRSPSVRRSGPVFRARAIACGSPRVLLVDDVTTTGASLSRAAQAMRTARFGEILSATVARSGQDARARPTQPVDSGNGRPSKHQTS